MAAAEAEVEGDEEVQRLLIEGIAAGGTDTDAAAANTDTDRKAAPPPTAPPVAAGGAPSHAANETAPEGAVVLEVIFGFFGESSPEKTRTQVLEKRQESAPPR